MNSHYAHHLVGHRGLMASHPENTLAGYKAAIAAGARFIECDVQLTKDRQPVVLHDHELSRTAGLKGTIFDQSLAQAKSISVHEASKFGEQYKPEYIATLDEFLALLQQYPDVTAMVELKQESIDQFSLAEFIEVVFELVSRCKSQVIVISFNSDVVSEAKKVGLTSGWVIRNMDAASEQLASKLLPEYLITDVRKIDVNAPQLWSAPQGHCWQWMLYDVLDAALAKSLMDQGVDLIETGDIAGLIEVL
jgi:glycerophosphoryl diester phosphodiesterase